MLAKRRVQSHIRRGIAPDGAPLGDLMKPVVIALLLSVASVAAAADERNPTHLFDPGSHVDAAGIVRNSGGRPIGRIEADVKGSHVLRDNSGREVGSVEFSSGGNQLVIRDGAGRRQGTLERRP